MAAIGINGGKMLARIGTKTKLLLSVTGTIEAATGIVLLVVPLPLVELLLGAAPDAPVDLAVSRVAGGAILALGVACWLARQDAEAIAAKGLVVAMLLYNVAVVAVLAFAWLHGVSGIALWPVVAGHVVLAAWCAACGLAPTRIVPHH